MSKDQITLKTTRKVISIAPASWVLNMLDRPSGILTVYNPRTQTVMVIDERFAHQQARFINV